MPMIQIHMLPGRTNEEKAACLKAIHEAVTSTLGVPDSAVRAWISDMDPHAFIRNGESSRSTAAESTALSSGCFGPDSIRARWSSSTLTHAS